MVLAEAAMAVDLVRDAQWDVRLRRSFETLIGLVVAQPAAARMCLVDAYEAGPEAVAYVDRMTRAAGRRALAVLEESPERAGMPRDVARAAIGGLRKVIQTRLYDGRVDELPELAPALMDWALDYRAPAVPLRAATPPPTGADDSNEPAVARRRRIALATARVATAEGFAGTTLERIAAAAEMPVEEIAGEFATRDEALDAALDDAVARMLEATTGAYRSAPDWPRGVRDGFAVLFSHLSRHTETAGIVAAAVWAGPEVLMRLDAALTGFTALIAEGLRSRSGTPGVGAEAIGSSILALAFERISRGESERLYEIAPTSAFIAIAPAVGTIEACALINDG